MNVDEILEDVRFLVDGTGRRTAAQLDIALWEQLVNWLKVNYRKQEVSQKDIALSFYHTEMSTLNELLDIHAINTGIPDLAEEHDHYLYGTPKRGSE